MKEQSYSSKLFNSINEFEETIRLGLGWIAREELVDAFLRHPRGEWLSEYVDDRTEPFFFALLEDCLEKDGIEILDAEEVEEELRRNSVEDI